MAEALKALEEIKKINASFPFSEPAKKWKQEGKKVVGWTCINVPEEIIHAGGMMPFRITGGKEEITLDRANEILYSGSTCSFIRTCMELELRGEYDFLDCIASCTPCEGVMRLTEVGKYYHNINSSIRAMGRAKHRESSIARKELFDKRWAYAGQANT